MDAAPVEVDSPSTPEVAATAVAAAAVVAAASIPVEPVAAAPVDANPAADIAPEQPLSRRARRAFQPEREATPSLPDAVLTPVEPFELLEPVAIEDAVPVEAILEETASSEPVFAEPTFAEPIVDQSFTAEPTVAEPVAAPTHSASDVDEFEAAARLFSFTGETPIQTEAETQVAPESEPAPAHHGRRRSAHQPGGKQPTAAQPSRPSNGAAFKRVTAASFSVGVMGIVGLLTVGLTTPAEAVAVASGNDIASVVVAPGDIGGGDIQQDAQAYVAPATAEDVQLNRPETYATATMAQLAQESGIHNFSNFFVNDPNSPIQWPFAVGVPISYGFGMRSGRMHEGVDFTPGAGSPIQAVADGVVRIATNSGGAYGVTVVIDHQIDGQLVSSRYAHMQYGSLQVAVGQHVTVGTIIGRTGNTGRSFGAHTHFEILLGGTTAIDPIPWLRAHAGG